jgi:hypothetical protein
LAGQHTIKSIYKTQQLFCIPTMNRLRNQGKNPIYNSLKNTYKKFNEENKDLFNGNYKSWTLER